MENRGEFIQAQLHAFLSAMYDIESLAEFYHRSAKTVDTFAKAQEKECEVGLRIGQLFNEVVECKGKEVRNKKIDEIKSVAVDGGTELQEIVDVLYFTDNEQPLQFTMKGDYTWNYLYSPNEAHRKMISISGYRTILIETVLSHIQVIYEKYLGSTLYTLILAEPLKYIGNETIIVNDKSNLTMT